MVRYRRVLARFQKNLVTATAGTRHFIKVYSRGVITSSTRPPSAEVPYPPQAVCANPGPSDGIPHARQHVISILKGIPKRLYKHESDPRAPTCSTRPQLGSLAVQLSSETLQGEGANLLYSRGKVPIVEYHTAEKWMRERGGAAPGSPSGCGMPP